ncbi:ABC transporter ATP-binding protein [Nakamurella endophytica]|uniref:ABC transporter ATP-binding protein n=1 Tax=Nakamurella endophytica TaxID=1748367 RepID=A0A917WE58_9ACTN|nr:ABC transporter ATP-binding protein [Nakamurella endophytica]GGL96321.1 ABC transporter ATP-binding protein [Nakamurella endophytica]
MIEVSDLSKVYGQTVAVDHLSFTVRPGTVTGFLGPNGAGKSTTMRMILGLDNPSSGQALIEGRRYADLQRPLTVVGALLDATWIHPNRTARSHLRWLAASNGLPRRRVDEVLDIVGLSSVAGKAAGKFSLGMKQRLGLAGAILGDPRVLLFDEPVNGLDPEGILWIRQFMRSLASAGRTVLVSSHLLSEMAVTADHLVVIGRGRLIADASTQEFISAATETTVRVRSPQLPQLAELLRGQGIRVSEQDGALSVSASPIEQVGELAGRAGIVLHELASVTGSLEQAFMQLTGDAVEYGGHSAVPGGPGPGGPGYGGPGYGGPGYGGPGPGGPFGGMHPGAPAGSGPAGPAGPPGGPPPPHAGHTTPTGAR